MEDNIDRSRKTPDNHSSDPDIPRHLARKHPGQFKPGQSGNPKGRPPKIYNQSSVLVTELLEESATAITQAAIDEAKAGNALAIKLCLDRLAPAPHTRSVRVDLTNSKPARAQTAESLLADHTAILAAVAEGAITPEEGESLSAIVEARRRSWESTQLADRIGTLEDSVEAIRKRGSARPQIRWVSSDPSGNRDKPSPHAGNEPASSKPRDGDNDPDQKEDSKQ